MRDGLWKYPASGVAPGRRMQISRPLDQPLARPSPLGKALGKGWARRRIKSLHARSAVAIKVYIQS